MIKVCSFLPAATSMIYHMGLEEHLTGVTFECHSDKPKVVRSLLEGKELSSKEIDRIVSEAKAQSKSLYYIDEDLLQEISPDIIFTQDVCEVCQIDTACVERAICKLEKQPVLIPLLPKRLTDVFDDAVTIAKSLNKEENSYRLLSDMQSRINQITDTLRLHQAPVKRISVFEWIHPIYNSGHWIPDMIGLAGGVDGLSNPGSYSSVIAWERIVHYDPEIIVIAPCGFLPERALQEVSLLTSKINWNQLTAVNGNHVFVVDSNLFTCPSTDLVSGIEVMAALFHPKLFALPDHLQQAVHSFKTMESHV